MSGSVFRRGGQKVEAHGNPSEQQISGLQLETKLAALRKSWSAPLTASTQSVAVWRPESNGAEVTIERGNLLQRMGYRHHRKLHLHVEEAVYLVSRGSLLLSVFNAAGEQQLLSLQQAMEMMVSTGVSIAQYQVYCHLVQAGYIVTRHPAVWSLDDSQDPHQIWGNSHDRGQHPTLPTEHIKGIFPNPPDPAAQEPTWGASSEDSSSLPPPLKRLKPSTTASLETDTSLHRKWWPAPTEVLQDLPRCDVVMDEDGNSQTMPLPRLKPFPSIAYGSSGSAVKVPDDLKLVYDVLKPNKRFSKGNPDGPKLAVCFSSGSNVPARNVMHHLQAAVAPLPLQFARVSGGEVSFHSLQSLS